MFCAFLVLGHRLRLRFPHRLVVKVFKPYTPHAMLAKLSPQVAPLTYLNTKSPTPDAENGLVSIYGRLTFLPR